MNFIEEIYCSKTFKGWFTRAELERAWQVILKEKPYLKNVPVNKKKKNLGKWCKEQLAPRKIPRIKAPENMVIRHKLSVQPLNDNQIFFLKRKLGDWLKDNFISPADLIVGLVDEHNDAAKEPDATKYVEDIAKLFKVFNLDIYDEACYN